MRLKKPPKIKKGEVPSRDIRPCVQKIVLLFQRAELGDRFQAGQHDAGRGLPRPRVSAKPPYSVIVASQVPPSLLQEIRAK